MAFPASFQHVGQPPTQGASNKGNRPIKNLVHFGLQDKGFRTLSKFLVFSTLKLIGPGHQIRGKQADKKFGPFWPPGPRWSNLIKIFSLFNAQTNRPRALPASFQHVGQPPTQGASNKGK